MQKIKTLPRIDKYTCKFENPVMEERFMREKWLRLRKAINVSIALFAFIFFVDGIGMYHSLGGFQAALLPFPFFIGGLLLFFRIPKKWKSSYFDVFFAAFLLSCLVAIC